MYLRPIRGKRLQKRGQGGYVMLVILLMLVLLTLAIVEAAPAVAVDIKRQQEEELIHRGDQYARAIRRFFKKFNRYPTSLDELKETNHLRFLRREYKDPITGGDFKLLHPMDIKFQPKGFFGKSLPGAGNIGGTSPFGSNPAGSSRQNPSTAQNPLPSDGSQPAGQQSNQLPGQSGSPDQGAAKTDSNGFRPGQVFGGGPIVGVASTSTNTSIIELDGKNHYDEWQFFYVPQMEQGQMFPPGGVPGGAGGGTTGQKGSIQK